MNTTQVFESLQAFRRRRNKKINGVSRQHAIDNPNYEEDNATNVGCWNCKDCIDSIGCYMCEGCKNTEYSYDCFRCIDCTNCEGCVMCEQCVDCDYYFLCINLYDTVKPKNITLH